MKHSYSFTAFTFSFTVKVNSDTGNGLIMPKQHQCHLQVKSQCQKKMTFLNILSIKMLNDKGYNNAFNVMLAENCRQHKP